MKTFLLPISSRPNSVFSKMLLATLIITVVYKHMCHNSVINGQGLAPTAYTGFSFFQGPTYITLLVEKSENIWVWHGIDIMWSMLETRCDNIWQLLTS